MNGSWRNTKNAKIWGKKSDLNCDGSCTSQHLQSRMYEISGCLIFVEQIVPINRKGVKQFVVIIDASHFSN
jgi:hypothetical protein